MKNYAIMSLSFLVIVLTSFQLATFSEEEVQYPEGYRSWTHVKTGMLGPEHPNVEYRGFNHIYANDTAVEGYTSGTFPEGSVLVVDVVTAVQANGNYTGEGKRHHMDVIQKDSLRFAGTGGWGYAQFESDNAPRMLTLDQKKTCNTCHLKQPDHVFSELRK